jgi:hypothetical protein
VTEQNPASAAKARRRPLPGARRALTLWLAWAALPALAQSPGDEELVRQFYPERLRVAARKLKAEGLGTAELHAFARARLEGPGSAEYIVAVYTNYHGGAIRVLRKEQDGATLVHEPDLPQLGGIYPQLELRDLDGDDRPEVIAIFEGSRAETTWVFRWNGSTLELLGPSDAHEGVVSTGLGTVFILDLDGDGTSELVNAGTPLSDVYDLAGALRKQLLFVAEYERTADSPAVLRQQFADPRHDREAILRLRSGRVGGAAEVASAAVRVNGAEVVSAAELAASGGELARPLTLCEDNELEVQWSGPVGSRLLISVEPAIDEPSR